MASSRREFLAGAAAGILLPTLSRLTQSSSRKRIARIAHLTDIHVQPERGATEGFETALEHALGQSDKPDIIFTGGDLIMDALGASEERTRTQWDLFQRVLRGIDTRIEHTIGNHDVWGWGDRAAYEGQSKFGKVWALEVLELESPYRSFDLSNWKVIVLDSTHRLEGNGYTARLDDAQFEWLSGELTAAGDRPVLIVSHIPIISATAYFDGDNEKSGNWVVPGAWMHLDARKIKDLFRERGNVRLAISGHIHLVDQVLYNDTTYFCAGATSAGWWGGDYQECTYGYSLVDLFDDGSFENRYVPYGWKTRD